MNQSKDSQVDAFKEDLSPAAAEVRGFDTLITNAKVFNNGEAAVIEDVAIAGGRIVARGQNLDQTSAAQVIDAEGLWLMPGLFDIHTHYDLELEVAPGLPESTRHGTTSVVIANCSLGFSLWQPARRHQ